MAIDVNYYDSIIYITSPTTDVTIQELIDEIRATEDTPVGMAFGEPVAKLEDAIADAEGKVDVGSGFLNPITMTLAATWYIEFWDGVNLGTIAGGNITGGLSSRPVRAAAGSADTVLQLGAERGIEVAASAVSWDDTLDDHRDANTFGEAIRKILWGSK
jgi:hypothetical protein